MKLRDLAELKVAVRPVEHEENDCIKSILQEDFYPDLKVSAVSPRWYYKQIYHESDEFSKRIIRLKKCKDETKYFEPYVKNCIDKFKSVMGFSEVELVSAIPNSNNKYYGTIINLLKIVGIKLSVDSKFVLDRKPGRRTGHHREDRFNDLHGKFKVKSGIDVENKKILLIDDVRASGMSILECSSVLLKAGAKEIISLSLGTNTSKEPPKKEGD
jgi:predicted amidophosphoribosyltransferase